MKQQAPTSLRPTYTGRSQPNLNAVHATEENTSQADFERDSKNVFSSDGLMSEIQSQAGQSSNIAVSVAANSVQLQRLVLLSQQQLKEIRAFTANEIFKTRKLTNKLFKEFE